MNSFKEKMIETLIAYDFYFLEYENHIELKNGIIFLSNNNYNFIDKNNFFISSNKPTDIIGVLEFKFSKN